MKESRNEFLDGIAGERANVSGEEFAALKQFVEQRDRATAPTAAALMENAPAPSTSIGMFMPSTVPEMRGRENLATFLQYFRTWACVSRCDSALNSEIIERTSRTLLALVDKSLKAWQALT